MCAYLGAGQPDQHFMSCVSLIHLDLPQLCDWYLLKQNKISPRRHAEDRDLEKQAFVFGVKIV